ncbi:hypothetical protein ACIQOW_01335 [Kitasatospora sp. NPDC091335]|uniref:hypothetical protein n=1 Tax=Kitasatospora sp. NPDC091335 TaxID=3364085 RepID=UPI00382F290B
MKDRDTISNAIHGGQVDGTLIQAGAVHGGIQVVNRAIRGSRSSRGGLIYRVVASLAGCAAVYGTTHGGTPLSGLAAACERLGIPAEWTIPIADWASSRSDGICFVATLLAMIGILALPKPRKLGWDVGESLEWRSPSTTVLAASVVAQCGWSWSATINIGLAAAFSVWAVGRSPHNIYGRWGNVSIAAISLMLALLFIPLYVSLWLFTRDEPN